MVPQLRSHAQTPMRAPTAGGGSGRRMRRGERRQSILDAATDFFAEEGFHGGTRALARRLGVTQALLYRYFASKEALIEAVFEALVDRDPAPPAPEALDDPARPLDDRIGDLLIAWFKTVDPRTLRLLLRAGLDGYDLAGRIEAINHRRVTRPVVAAQRHELGLPDFDDRPLLTGECELVQTLYGGVLHLSIRRHVFDRPIPDAPETLLRIHARMFVDGARTELPQIHRLPPDAPLARPAVTPREG